MLALSALALLCLGALSCNCGPACLPTPALDASPPDIVVLIDYVDLSGAPQSKAIDWQDPPVSIDAGKAFPFHVHSWGHDQQGMKYVHLDGRFESRTASGLVSTSPIDNPINPVTCPLEGLTGVNDFPAVTTARDVFMTVQAMNWVNRSTSTPQIVVHQK
jgi:hypothetical protein